MKNKIIFFGSSDFATESLKEIIYQKYNLVAVVTNPDKAAGRGMKINKTKVKVLSEENKLNILQPLDLNEETFHKKLENLKPDLFIVVAFKKLPEKIWKIPKLGTFNLHASLLPMYRGAAPINWAIINGEKETGLTTFFINNNIDCGNIIMQKKCEIKKNETFGELYAKLMKLSPNIISKTIEKIFKGNLKTHKQIELKNQLKAPKFFKKDIIIDWKQDCEKIFNFIRGFSPSPGARTILQITNKNKEKRQQELIITKVSNYQINKHYKEDAKNTFELLFNSKEKTIIVQNKDGKFFIERIKIPGKKEIDAISFGNGFLNKKENIGYYHFI